MKRTNTRMELSKVCKVLQSSTKHGYALNWAEVAAAAGTGRKTVGILKALQKQGKVSTHGRDTVGPGWVYVEPKKMKNPISAGSPVKKALKGALRWYQDPSLVDEPRELVGYKAPDAFVKVGTIVSICYRSNKYDGKSRDWEHEFTKERDLLISIDGSTMIVDPPFQFTKQGIKG